MRKVVLLIIVLAVVVGFFYYKNFLIPQDKDRVGGINQDAKIEQANSKEEQKTPQENSVIAQEFLENASDVFFENVEIQRFWFLKEEVDSSPTFYVEYVNSQGNQHKTLIQKTGEDSYKILATFLPGRNEWELETGEDILFAQELKIYVPK